MSATPIAPAAADPDEKSLIKRDLDVEVNGKRFSVSMWVPEAAFSSGNPTPRVRRSGAGGAGAGGAGNGDIAAPMQGTIVRVVVAVGDKVEVGDPIVVLEAMKMENNVNADKAGIVKEIRVSEGDSVGGGDIVAVIE